MDSERCLAGAEGSVPECTRADACIVGYMHTTTTGANQAAQSQVLVGVYRAMRVHRGGGRA